MKSITLHVTGMTCGGCVKSVTRVLEELNGVEKAVVTLDDGKSGFRTRYFDNYSKSGI